MRMNNSYCLCTKFIWWGALNTPAGHALHLSNVNIVTCTGGTRDEMTGSSSDDWILLALWLQPLLITLHHNPITIPHTLQSTVAQALGFSISTSRLLATGLNTETALQITMKSSCHFFNHHGMPIKFSDSNSSVSVLHGTNMYSLISTIH
jgi:hypothetical protein